MSNLRTMSGVGFIRRSLSRFASGMLAAAFLFGMGTAWAQEVVLFALKGDGTASATIDRAAKKAWITDGGRSGAQGVREARIADQDLLNYLLSIGVRDLAIICSHPHSDHMGGLEDLVADRRILSFASIFFVDNGVPAPKSLYGMFQANWSSQTAKPETAYASAERAEAFGRSKMAGGDVSVRNFVYDATKVGKTEHDRSVVMQYRINGKPPQTVVDFDDASSALVEHWAKQPGAAATVLIHPHHGSRNNSIDVILKNKEAIGLKDVVITVNRRNRYLHPAPETLLNLLQLLGPDHVFVTDSDIGENVRITNAGTTDGRKAEDHIARLRAFALAQRERYDAKARQELQLRDADSAITITARWNDVVDQSLDKRRKVGIDARLRDYFGAVATYDEVIAILESARGGKAWHPGMFKPRRRPPPEQPAGSRPEDSPKGPGGGSGEFFRKEQQAKGERGEGASVGSRFEDEINRALPRFGGIVIGNDVSGPTVDSVEFVNPEVGVDGAAQQVVVRLTIKGGGSVDYVNVTNAELWAAYNFVQPNSALLGRYKQQSFQSPGVVGLSTDSKGVSKVALHPALAGTALGWSAMYADNVMGYAKKKFDATKLNSLPIAFRSLHWSDFRYDALQWFDEKSAATVDAALVVVRPATNDLDCLLRLRVSTGPTESEVTDYLKDELAKRIVAALKRDYPDSVVESTYRGIRKVVEKREPQRAPAEQRLIAAQATIAKLKGSDATDSFYSQVVKDLKNSKISESSLWKTKSWPNDQTQSICAAYPPLMAINRFAKLVAVLNWAKRTSGKALPDLPKWVRPIWNSTPDEVEMPQDPFFGAMQ